MNRKDILASLQSLLELCSVILQLMPCEGEDYESFSRFFFVSLSLTHLVYMSSHFKIKIQDTS